MTEVYTLLPATKEHAAELALTMRAADIAEVKAASGGKPIDALTKGVEMSADPFTLLYRGEVLCMYGMATDPVEYPGMAAPWLLASDKFENHRRLILGPVFRGYVEAMAKKFSLLINMVDARHEKSISWLRWLGFEILPPQPLGVNGEMFNVFQMRGSNV